MIVPVKRWLDLGDADQHDVGGKAMGLSRLHRAGLPVPDGFVVPASVMQQVLSTCAGDRSETLRHAPLPDDWTAAWREAGASLGPRLAVRSSAVGEDGQQKSHAGVYRTILGVEPAALPSAIREVWSSALQQEADAYRGGGKPAAMAVLVQPMVEAAVSGVMFTVNPANGSWREMMVEAVWGLGEPLVSGQLAPHWYLVRRPRRLPSTLGRAMARVQLRVMQQQTPRQAIWMRLADGEPVVESTPEDLATSRTLSDGSLRRLCRLGLRAERALGVPADVEWALDEAGNFTVLQARPITTRVPERRRDDVLWTRRFLGERWTEPASPMGWSMVGPTLSWFIAYPDTQARYLGGGPPLKLMAGRPYVNATVFRHLAFKPPGAPPPAFLLELLPPDEALSWRTRFAGAPDLPVVWSLLRETWRERRWQRFAFNPLTNPSEWQAFVHEMRPMLQRRVHPSTPPSELVRLVEAHLVAMRRYVGIHVTSLLFANLAYQWLESVLIQASVEDGQRWMKALAISAPGNRTLVTNRALWKLSRTAHPGDLDALASGEPLSPAFRDALADFLHRFGHRSSASWEVFSRRWRDHPGDLVPLLRAQEDSEHHDPEARRVAMEAEFHDTRRELMRRLSWSQTAGILTLVHYTRRYLRLRENQRAWFEHLLQKLHRLLLQGGEGLVSAGHLEHAADVQWLTWEELRGVLESSLDGARLAQWVERRRLEHREFEDGSAPTFVRGDRVLVGSSEGGRLSGLGIGGGRARGVARLLRSPGEGGRLQPGDVLVTHSVDPSWTPLFRTCAAIVTEMGGILSHGAVVAREYGVPMVVNVEDVTGRLEDGQEITVDGSLGVVWVHP